MTLAVEPCIAPAARVEGLGFAARWALYALVAVSPWLTFVTEKLETRFELQGLELSPIGAAKDVLVVALVTVVAADYVQLRVFPRVRVNVWLCAAAAFATVALFRVATDANALSMFLLRTYLLPLVLFVALAVVPIEAMVITNLLRIFVVNGIAFAAIAVVEYFGHVQAFQIGVEGAEIFDRSSAIFDSPNVLASQLLIPIAALASVYFQHDRGNQKRLLAFGTLALLLLGLFLSASRAGFIAVFAALTILAIRRARVLVLVPLVLVLLVEPVGLYLDDHDYEWHVASGVIEAAQVRLGLLEEVSHREGREVIVSPERRKDDDPDAIAATSNSVARLYVDYGVGGVAFYAVIVVGVLLGLVRRHTEIARLGLAVVVGFVVMSLFHDFILAFPQMLFAFAFAAFGLHNSFSRGETERAPLL